MRGGIRFETKAKVVIVLFQMSFRPTCCPQGKWGSKGAKCRNYQMICNISLKPGWIICVMLCRGVIM